MRLFRLNLTIPFIRLLAVSNPYPEDRVPLVKVEEVTDLRTYVQTPEYVAHNFTRVNDEEG